MKKITSLCLALFGFINFYAQDPNILWQNTIGGSEEEELRVSIPTLDNGFLLGGYSVSNISGDKTENNIGERDYWIIKLNSTGNIEWENTIGGIDDDFLTSVIETTDNGYIIAGWSRSDISGDKTENSKGSEDFWILKLNMNGIIQWQKTIGGNASDNLYDIVQTNDGGFFIGGTSASNISGDKTENSKGSNDYWIVKLDDVGNIEWQRTIGGDQGDTLRCVLQTTDEGYILGGYSISNISGDKTENCQGSDDYWIVKLDSFGNIEWQNTIGGNDGDYLWDIKQSPDEGYIIAGESFSNLSGDKTENNVGLSDYWIVKLDGSGNIEWQNTIGGNLDEGCFDTFCADNGTFLIVGYSDSNLSGDKTAPSNGSTDIWLLTLDSSGDIIEQYSIGGNHADYAANVFQTFDNKIFLGGNSRSDISGDKTENSIGGNDYWVLKLDGLLSLEENAFATSLTLHPNPAKDILQINTAEQIIDKATIYTLTGNRISQTNPKSPSPKLDVSNLASGVYYLQLYSGKNVAVKKFIKE